MELNKEKIDNVEESATLSIRTKKNVAEEFRQISIDEDLSQGETLEKLLEVYKEKQDNNEMNKYKILVKPLKQEDSKAIVFQGKLIYSIQRRKVTNLFLESLVDNQVLKDYTSGDVVEYAVDIYETAKKQFLIHEHLIQTSSKNVAKIDSYKYNIVQKASNINDVLGGRIYTSESNDILLLTLDEEILDV